MYKEPDGKEPKQPVIISDTEESDEEVPDIEINAGNKDTCVLEVNLLTNNTLI